MNISIVIPTINRIDLLEQLLQSLRHQDHNYQSIIVIDNGNQSIENICARQETILNLTNKGVAASWNQGIDLALKDELVDYVLILNDDIILAENQLGAIKENLTRLRDKWLFIGPYHWAVWMISRAGVHAIKKLDSYLLDENFFPAYFEDNDLFFRVMSRFPDKVIADCEFLDPEVKRSNSSSKADKSLRKNFEENRIYYRTKWAGDVGRERRLPHEDLTSELCYRSHCQSSCELNEHLESISALASSCNHVTEFGSGSGRVTWALLRGRPHIIRSYDLRQSAALGLIKHVSKIECVDYEFSKIDVLAHDIENTQLLIIDTLHNYSQLRAELNRHASKVTKYIAILHTVSFGYRDETPDGEILKKRGLITAIIDFLESHDGSLWEHYGTDINQNGLTILSKKFK